MSLGFNTKFMSDTKVFLQNNFLTALGIPPLFSGHAMFDLVYHFLKGQHIVILRYVHLGNQDQYPDKEGPIFGYWLPQGGSCLIPVNPRSLRTVVFTPDFSGCSIMVDQIDANNYRVYHVQGGGTYFQDEYLNDPLRKDGLGLAASMRPNDYGDADQPRGFAFLKHEQGHWWIYMQKQTGVGLGWNQGKLTPIGPQVPRGGARVLVADLQRKVLRPPNNETW
jgi:hypothetical protein